MGFYCRAAGLDIIGSLGVVREQGGLVEGRDTEFKSLQMACKSGVSIPGECSLAWSSVRSASLFLCLDLVRGSFSLTELEPSLTRTREKLLLPILASKLSSGCCSRKFSSPGSLLSEAAETVHSTQLPQLVAA